MNKYINLFLLIFLIGCSTNNEVFWCGDHACVNKKEKEKYFMENMIVEIKNVKNDDDIENSKFDQVIRQADSLNKDKKKYSNLTKKQKKQKIKEEKRLAKLIKKQELKRIKEEEKIQKQIKKDELLRIKNMKKNAKRLKKEEMITKKSKINKNKNILNKKTASNKKVKKIDVKNDAYKKSSDFLDIVKVIEKKSNTKSFPDINKNFE